MTEKFLHYDQLRNIAIGTLDFVSPTEFKILLDISAPQNTAIDEGIPTLFPKINGFVLIPNEVGAIVATISWIGIEHSAFPRRTGLKDFDLIDLPFPQRKMSVNPLGVLKNDPQKGYIFERGIYTYPSVGDSVILPIPEQLIAIVTNKDKNAQVNIGVAPIAADAPVNIDPDKLFGRHLAVLGNTGSGKSCTVAGLIRWSLQAARKEKDNCKKDSISTNNKLNSRFIILDPNGEYSNTFDDIGTSVKKYKVKLEDQKDFEQLIVPAWMWNSNEWISFSRAAPGAQRPLLLEALTLLRRGKGVNDDICIRLNRFLNGYKQFFRSVLAIPPANMQQRDNYRCRDGFDHLLTDINTYLEQTGTTANVNQKLIAFRANTEKIYHKNSNLSGTTRYFNGITENELNEIIDQIDEIMSILPIEKLAESDTVTADTPKEFELENLPDFLEQIANLEGGDFGRFVNTLNLRLRILINDERAKQIVNPEESIELDKWLNQYICDSSIPEQITIVDLALVPSEIVHLIIAVISRLIFEALQRYRHTVGKELPTVMVLEEAHSFIRRYTEEEEVSSARMCCQTFERIAREGRKFGLGLLLSSQRPSELSPTVLSQCNTFILHRLVNDRDQELVGRLIPDNLGGLLKELPILPTRKAILLGWAAPIPILVEINELKEHQRPHSADPKFWNVWTGKEERPISWKTIADDWVR